MMPEPTVSPTYQASPAKAQSFLEKLLRQQARPEGMHWLDQQRNKIRYNASRTLFMAFSLCSRYFESKKVALSPDQRLEADKIRAGFMPQFWSELQAARALLLLEMANQTEAQLIQALTQLAETADVAEQTALYAALPLLPYPVALQKRAAEGIRTNITLVFDAIALHNPYPADYLEESAWNQMVLKAVFMGRPLYQIQGADRRANPALARMLTDFAHERWAAHRSVTPELWRFVGPYLEKESFKDIERVSREGTPLEKRAALLACAASSYPEAKQLLSQDPDTERKIRSGELSWDSLGEQHGRLSS